MTHRERTAATPAARPNVTLPDYLVAPTATRRPSPLRSYRRWVLVADLLVIAAASAIGYLARFGVPATLDEAIAPYRALGVGLVAVWLLALYIRGCYDTRRLGVGPEEYSRILSGSLLLFALLAGIGYLVNSDVSRAYVFISLPVGAALLLAERWTVRRFLYRQRARGRACYRTVLLGTPDQVGDLAAELRTDAFAGYVVVASHAPPGSGADALDRWLDEVDDLLTHRDAEAVAVAPSSRLDAEVVRRLGWRLEGRGIDLLVAPALSDVAGPRITMRPAAGLPLMHLEEPGLSSAQAIAKRTLDLAGALIGLVVLSPLMLVIAIAVRTTSRGPVLFRQWRVGQGGRVFRILKFRTMTDDADAQRQHLRDDAGHDGPGFKHPCDPRITRVGRFLRRWSLDEWPQLVNVVRNDMSLVGPRPHPLDDVDRYSAHDFRRLLAKPGMTGLWQVEGRSELDWAESVQLDLYYIENWSLVGDVILMLRTVRAVLTGRGAT